MLKKATAGEMDGESGAEKKKTEGDEEYAVRYCYWRLRHFLEKEKLFCFRSAYPINALL